MGWWQREQQKNSRIARQKEEQAAAQAKKDQQAAARDQLVGSWQDLYNTGGDQAVADNIIANYSAQGSSYTEQDLADAKAVKEGKTFQEVSSAKTDAAYKQYNQLFGSNKTRYGPQGQLVTQLITWDDWSKNIQKYDNFSGYVDPQIQIDKDKAAADKAAADKAAADKAAAAAKRQADLDAAQRQKDAAAQAALQKKPAPTPQAPVKKETPIEGAKGRTGRV